MLLICPNSAMCSWWSKVDMDQNLCPGMYAWLKLKLDSKFQYYKSATKGSVVKLTDPITSQPKPGAFLLQVFHGALAVRHEYQTGHWKAFARSSGSLIFLTWNIFVSPSYQTGLETMSITWRSIIVRIRGGRGLAWADARAEVQALPNFAGHPPI